MKNRIEKESEIQFFLSRLKKIKKPDSAILAIRKIYGTGFLIKK